MHDWFIQKIIEQLSIEVDLSVNGIKVSEKSRVTRVSLNEMEEQVVMLGGIHAGSQKESIIQTGNFVTSFNS